MSEWTEENSKELDKAVLSIRFRILNTGIAFFEKLLGKEGKK